ncbi:MAG TPA: KUP/HAK/KT family potassium transporter [Polyangia bacterium]|nr:KUP/HAK/KT family potassium transporter [Polyangia bacterium]
MRADAKPRLSSLTLGALGVVFGDIGTSPLYTLHECLTPGRGVAPTPGAILGILSLIFWSLVVVVAVKYLTFVVRADKNGEGGIFALFALLPERLRDGHGGTRWMTALVLVGAALLFGDGVITPSISVLSAIEGLRVAAPEHRAIVVPATCLILVALFILQRRGTGTIGKLFGPVMLVWFIVLGVLGARQILRHPGVLAALDPSHAVRFFAVHRGHGFLVLGSVVLAITGVEALYADLGHFGRAPIRAAWFLLVMPALVVGYFGQGALMLSMPSDTAMSFFSMAPRGPWTYALVGLATAATVIASQALISGVFSLTHQAIQLGYFPVLTVTHTSSQAEGQVYVPAINWCLCTACVALVLVFRHSSRLAAAYGLAVTGTMVITSLIFFEVTRRAWRWPLWKSVPLVALFLSFDVPFFGATLSKLTEGGFIPVLIGLALFVVMFTWKRGWTLYRARLASNAERLDRLFVDDGAGRDVARVAGAGIFVSGEVDGVPPVLSSFLDRIRALPEQVVVLKLATLRAPHAMEIELETLDGGLHHLSIKNGFMDRPDVPAALAQAIARHGLPIDMNDVTYYLGHHTFAATSAGKMGRASEWLFSLLARNARPATEHFGIPPDQVVEIGSLIDL